MSKQPQRTGTFLGLPYDWRRLNWARIKQRTWNPNDRHIFTPKSFGWGLTVNLYEVCRRLGLVGRQGGAGGRRSAGAAPPRKPGSGS
ncbi:MAG: DUF5808 domain-containing protein [Dehalococcoidia bacterium]